MSNEAFIQIKHLKKSFDDLEVLRDINMDIHEGEVVCIIDRNRTGL